MVASTSRVTVVLSTVVVLHQCIASAQTTSAADASWSGQAQCVLVAKGPTYEDQQTHTWRMTGGPPLVIGSTRYWPAVWTVQGSGRIAAPSAIAGSGAREDRWTISVPETSAPIAIAEIPGPRGNNRIRISSQHGLLVSSGGMRVRASAGNEFSPGLQEWPFPAVDDALSSTVLSGTRTRTLRVGNGWRVPTGVMTTENCTWNFTRADALPQPSSTLQLSRLGTTGASRTTATNPNPVSRPTCPILADFSAEFDRLSSDVENTFATRVKLAATDAERSVVLKQRQEFLDAIAKAKAKFLAEVQKELEAAGGCQLPQARLSIMTDVMIEVVGTLREGLMPPQPSPPQVTARVTVNGPTTRVTLSWAVQSGRPAAYLVVGSGLPQDGIEVPASTNATGYSIDTGNLLIGTHAWLVTPLWKIPAGTMIDVGSAARVTATVGNRLGGVVADSIWDNLTKSVQARHDAWMAILSAANAR